MRRVMKASACLLALLVILSVSGLSPLTYFYRPLFKDRWGYYERKGFVWLPIQGARDRSGNYAFFDFKINMVVLIVSNDPNLIASSYVDISTPWSAKLLDETPHSFIASRDGDSLLVVKNGAVTKYKLKSGDAERYYGRVRQAFSDFRRNLERELIDFARAQ